MLSFDEFKVLAAKKGFKDMRLLPGLVVLANPYTPYDYEYRSNKKNAVSSAYYTASNRGTIALLELIGELKELGIQAKEAFELPHKPNACTANLGSYGKNQLIIHREYGSRFNIQLLAINHEWESDDNSDAYKACPEGCKRCIEACPTSALSEKGFERVKCLRNYMLSGNVIPEDMRKNMGMRLVGCETCQQACPRNKKDQTAVPEELLKALELKDLLSLGTEQNKECIAILGKFIGKNYVRVNRVCSQAAICAGNSGDTSLIPYLKTLESHENEAIKTHAAWALERLE